ncbi:hypothetical protein [Bradyrhizobium prioriisuperbiae]|uniref:hypothetical protein n=1 Tax=Bradyrhizobium prioriisuperbiae TaxID=2854389 RepID=UPI0028E603B8|nr:hypothetical protein [Bradyrhizobium prioritasuperba]
MQREKSGGVVSENFYVAIFWSRDPDRFEKCDNVQSMIRKKLPSENHRTPVRDIRLPVICTQSMCVRVSRSSLRFSQYFRPHSCAAACLWVTVIMLICRSTGEKGDAGNVPARHVLPPGRQKTPPKLLKNKKKYSPEFFGRCVEPSEAAWDVRHRRCGLEIGDELRA